MKLNIENVRGFAGSHSVQIKPITLLVGENSSGKTTLLSALAAALQPEFPTADVFNRAPFELGSFDTISTYRGGKYGRALSFSIGWEGNGRRACSITASFVNHHGIARVKNINIQGRDSQLIGDMETGEWGIEYKDKASPRPKVVKFKVDMTESRVFSLQDLPRLYMKAKSRADLVRSVDATAAVEYIFDLVVSFSSDRPGAVALAPLRTRPHRTYDELIEEFKPEGDHIPLVLARILSGDGASDHAVIAALESFGKLSGLFDKIKVKRMGKQPSDPFQLRVKATGPDANLVDVGYGVSQALPIVVDSILATGGSVVLVQQPEVHLHPKAQAALGTFFCHLVGGTGKRFVIETHSDYLLDRVRIAVADGVIKPDNVNIAFLERDGLDVIIHELQLDQAGNIINAPPTYRSFFMEEETRLLFRGN